MAVTTRARGHQPAERPWPDPSRQRTTIPANERDQLGSADALNAFERGDALDCVQRVECRSWSLRHTRARSSIRASQ
jgi:hypothetical protein